jgi:hypothetical protein
MSRDADWEMFCRGRAEPGDAPWATPGAGDHAVPLAPDDGTDAAGAAGPGGSSGTISHVHTRIVGVVYPNPDGTSRRDAVRTLRRLDLVRLAHRPDNPVDVNAVAVLREPDGHQLGYLPATLAKDVVGAARERGTRYLALVTEVTGVGPDDLISVAPVGASLLLMALDGGATRAQARRYLLGLMNRA